MEEVKEKIYCCEKDNSAMWAALMNKDNPAEMMALMNGNNNWNNSPWMYLIFLALFGGNGFGFGNRGDMACNYNTRLSELSGQISDNHNNSVALQAINGNRDALGQLAQTFNTDLGNIQMAICSVKSAIEQVAGQVGYSAESVKNAIALGDSNIIQQMQTCCCQQKELTQRMGYEAQLANERQTGILGSKIDDFRSQNQYGQFQMQTAISQQINENRQAVVNGFANIGYAMAQQTCDIKTNEDRNAQRIIDTLNGHWNQELQLKYQDAKLELSQQAQNAYLVSQLKTA